MSKVIKLTQGYEATVDDEDFEMLSQYKWYPLSSRAGVYYAIRNVPAKDNGGVKGTQSMHRLLLKESVVVDHINGDGLDNRKNNLRACYSGENTRNQKKRDGGTSKYKGVSWCNTTNKWVSQIQYNYKRISLGRFNCETAAAAAYNRACKKYFGEFARSNTFKEK